MKRMIIVTKSMTGYGRAQELIAGYDITVEIKSVNHRYFEFNPRVPRSYGYLEEKLNTLVHQNIHRGKIDVYVGIVPIEISDTQVHINRALASSYLEELSQLGEELGLENDITLSKLLSFQDIFSLQRVSEKEEILWAYVKTVAEKALSQFTAMRSVEGKKLEEDLLSHLVLLESYVLEVEKRSPEIVKEWRERLVQRITDVLENRLIDEARILTEAAIFAEKTAIDEETVRLKSHLSQFRTVLEEPQGVGRKLDFLVQEINREINTIGSKAQDSHASKLVVEMKSEAEKIREQIQNIE